MTLPANFYIPPSARIHDEPDRFRCRLCEYTTPDERDFGRHMKACSDRREDEIMEKHSRYQRNRFLYDPASEDTDVEWREWSRRTGDWH